MKRLFLLLWIAGLLSTLPAAEVDPREGAGGIIPGKEFSYAIGAPKGWIFDAELAPYIGVNVVIYPVGTTLSKAPAWIIANSFSLQGKIISQWIKDDITKLETDFPGIKVSNHKNLITADSLYAIVKSIAPGKSSYELYERSAYIKIANRVVVISLSSNNAKDYNKSIDAFEYVVSNFMRVTKDMVKEKK